MTLVVDQDPVCALAPYAAYPAFGDCVRPGRADRGLDDARAGRGEHLIEHAGELGIPVADEELDGLGALTQVHKPYKSAQRRYLLRATEQHPDWSAPYERSRVCLYISTDQKAGLSRRRIRLGAEPIGPTMAPQPRNQGKAQAGSRLLRLWLAP